MVGSYDLDRLRAFGVALGRLGMPWLLTLLGLSGGELEQLLIVPLLWFATPVLLWRLRAATRVAPETTRPWLLAAAAIGWCCWVVAVPASLVGAVEVVRTAHWIGTWLGLVLYTTAMTRLTQVIRWPAYERRWLQASRTAVLAGVIATVASAGVLGVELLDPVGPTGAGVPWVLLIGGAIVHVVALIRTARIHTPTHAALASVPTTASRAGPFSVGDGLEQGPASAGGSGPIQQQ